MIEWVVFSKDGSTERCRLKKLEYSGAFMNERSVTSTFVSPVEIDFGIFDYIEYRGEQFELEAIPTVKKTSSFSYEYELRFVSHKHELERCEMRDIVPNDNGVVYPTPLAFGFTGDVRYLAERIQACLDAMYGTGVWFIIVAEGTESDEANISISQQSCWNALSLVNTTYKLNYHIKGRTVTIGGDYSVVSHTFQYGRGNGLYEIERISDSDTAIVTKLRAFGGTKNLDYSYPKQPEWADSVLPVSFAFSPLRLMLPSFKKDGKTDFVMASDEAVAKYGVREASVVYEDIYPTISGMKNSSGQAIDEIKAVDTVDDTKSTFVIYLHDLGFDLEEHLTTADAQISMKSGAMQGYAFNMSAIEKQSDNSYKITLGRITTDSSDTDNYSIPNSNWNMKAGDKFVLLNILMPQEYIRDAEERLLERANEYLAQYSKTNFSYNISLHDKFLRQNPSVYNALIEGAKLSIYDGEIGINEEVTIQSLTITENTEENILPQVKVTLNNEVSASTLERIQGQIKELSDSTTGSFSSQSELLQQYRKKLDKPFFDRLFVAIDANGNEISSTDVSTPIAYIKAKYHFATVGGVTMFISDNNIDIPSVVEGLPFDNTTIWYNPTTKIIEVIGGTGGGTADAVAWDNITGKPTWIGTTKPSYTYSEIDGTPDLSVYATQSWVEGKGYALSSDLTALSIKLNDFLEGSDTDTIINKWLELEAFLSGLSESDNLATILGNKANSSDLANYIPISGYTDVLGEKNFTGGLKVNGSPIVYDATNKYWKLEGDLLVTGGVTMYANEGTYTPSTIMDALSVDNTNLKVVDGVLTFVGSTGGATTLGALSNVGSWADSVASQDRIMYQAANSSQWVAKNLSDLAVGGVTGDYLPLTGGELSGSLAVTATQNGYWSGGIRIDGTTEKPPSLAFHIANLAGWRLYMDKNQKLLWENSSNGQGVTSREILHTSNYSYYALPLSGGKLTGTLEIDSSTANTSTVFGTDYDGSLYYAYFDLIVGGTWKNNFVLYSDGNAKIKGNTIWHAGNDGSGSGLDADLLDGKHYSDIINGNVASATKLQTARTIWGQSFNGTGNIDGQLIINASTNYPIRITQSYGSTWTSAIVATNSALTAGQHYNIDFGHSVSAYNAAWVGYYHAGVGSTSNRLSMGLNSVDDVINILGTGNVGIGTTNPTAKLHVVGQILAESGELVSYKVIDQLTNHMGGSIELAGYYKPLSQKWSAYVASDFLGSQWCTVGGFTHGMIFKSGRSGFDNFIFLDSSGNPVARLSTSSGAGNHHFVGDVLATGGFTLYSDKRKKTILNHVELSLKEIAEAPLIEHYYNSDEKKTTHVGSIAQYWAGLNDWFCKLDSEGYYTMEIQNAALASAISVARELVKFENETDRRIRLLEEENKRLKEEVEQLKWNIA